MSGRWLTSKQVEIYMESRKAGKTQLASAAKASMSERMGREIDKGRYQDPRTKPRHWRTRKDPFELVWSSELELMLIRSPNLSALTLLEYLQSTYSSEVYPDNLLRTLQRKVKRWRYEKGPACEVIFRQQHVPGQLGFSDFTELSEHQVTIQGEPLKHLLYHFRVIYSGWSYMEVVLGGESFTALAHGLQNALWCLGGAPKEHRTDSLSAAYKNKSEEQDLTQQYECFCSHYNMIPSRNNRGVSHENGGIESPHGHLKKRIMQAFILRGSCDFGSVEEYQAWLMQVVNVHNRRNAKAVETEKMALQSLPSYKTADYTVLPVKVSSSSTIQVRTSLYTVPSRLIGATLQVHLYDDHLECYLGGALVAQLSRVYGKGRLRRAKNVDYRHVIDSLAKKPMAFYKSQLRDALLPNDTYRTIWKYLAVALPGRDASVLMVGLLHLAALADCEIALGEKSLQLLEAGQLPALHQLRKEFGMKSGSICPAVTVEQHPMSSYDSLIPLQGGSHELH